MSIFDKVQKKYGKYAIKHLMNYVLVIQLVGFFMIHFEPATRDFLAFDVELILKGEVWRLISFIAIPGADYIFFELLAIYIYYMFARSLETLWGSLWFDLYYVFGILGHIVAGFICYFVFGFNANFITVDFLNASLFMAYAYIFPESMIYIFFIIPVKMKWLANFEATIYGSIIVFGFLSPFLIPVAPKFYAFLFSLGIPAVIWYAVLVFCVMLNFIIFFILTRGARRKMYYFAGHINKKVQKEYKVKARPMAGPVHKCAVCGRTEKDYDGVFRFCSRCVGEYEYCEEHLTTHIHVTAEDLENAAVEEQADVPEKEQKID
jgi:hypothetical protein